MSVTVLGCGVVSPAGWGMEPFRQRLVSGDPVEVADAVGPGGSLWRSRRVPSRVGRPVWSMNPRMRRSSAISQFAMAAAWEALGGVAEGERLDGLGVICGVMGGSVAYSRRFYGEVLEDPATASPLLFPETVFNAPASHVGAVLGASGRNDTLVGDQSVFIPAMVQAADWLERGVVKTCLVIGAEEADWTTAEAGRLFDRDSVVGEGAAAVWLGTGPGSVRLGAVTEPRMYRRGVSRLEVGSEVWDEMQRWMGSGGGDVFRSGAGGAGWDLDRVFGDGRGAAGGWGCVAALDGLARGQGGKAGAWIAGANVQTVGAVFVRG